MDRPGHGRPLLSPTPLRPAGSSRVLGGCPAGRRAGLFQGLLQGTDHIIGTRDEDRSPACLELHPHGARSGFSRRFGRLFTDRLALQHAAAGLLDQLTLRGGVLDS